MTNNSAPTEGATAAFAKHKAAATATDDDADGGGAKMSLLARFMVFAFVPCFAGLCGLGVSYLESRRSRIFASESSEEGGEPPEVHEVDFDRDFVTPFLLSLALVIVLGFQTNGFTMQGGQRKAALVWPKARKVQRVRRERVIVEDEDVGDDGDKKKEQ